MQIYGCLLVSLLFGVVLSEEYRAEEAASSETGYRLPNNTKPENYDIFLITDIDRNNFIFSGRVIIFIRVIEDSSSITLHARQLTIDLLNLITESGTTINLNPIIYNETTEFITISTQSELKRGTNYILTVGYKGVLRTDKLGFYATSYTNSKGATKWLATTNFEPTDARHAFPCYDEPGFKAKFTIRIQHGESYHAISNMKETRNPAENGRVITEFDVTPPTSTYLIAFIVSDFEANIFSATNELPTTQRVFTRPDYINQTSHALVEGITILKAIGNYVQIPFVLPKLDQAAIPGSRVEAIEQFGLVTYPEERLIFDPDVHLAYRQLNVTTTTAHEFSHQWFGNLVSPKWWSNLWLSEGFATLFEAIATNMVHPQWSIFDNFIVRQLQPALLFDAQPKTHPMTYYVESPEALENLFDYTPYAKAGSVIRMFMHVLGEETFKKGVNYYLTNNTYGVADEDELFERLESAAKEDNALPDHLNVKDLFGSWSNQNGFPLLKVTRNYVDGSLTLYQSKYNAIFNPIESDPTTWWIPYNFASASIPIFNETTPLGWLPKGQRDMVINAHETGVTWTNNDWLLFNRQQTGFYRVLYDTENYNLLNKELNDGDLNKIHPINRAQILDDLHDFVMTGRVPSETLCNTLIYLKNETSYAPWETAKKAIDEWNQKLQASEKLSNFKTFTAGLVKPYYEKWTLNEAEREEVFDKLSRNTAVNLACEFGVPECLRDTYAKFQEMINGVQVQPNIRGLVIANGIRSASVNEIERLWEIYLNSSNLDERTEIISSTGNIQSNWTVQYCLVKSISDNGGKDMTVSERLLLVTSVIDSGHIGVRLAIQFLNEELEKVNSIVGSVPTILSSIARKVITKETSTQFSQLLDVAKQKGFVSDENIDTIESIAREKLNWQTNNLESFEVSFFAGKCIGSGGAKLMNFSALIMALVCLTCYLI